MTAPACPLAGSAGAPTCATGPLGRLRWVLTELAAIRRALRAEKATR